MVERQDTVAKEDLNCKKKHIKSELKKNEMFLEDR